MSSKKELAAEEAAAEKAAEEAAAEKAAEEESESTEPKTESEPGEEKKQGIYTKDTYEVTLPLSKETDGDVTVIVNGTVYRIQRGEPVKVPAAVYEVLKNSEKMDTLAAQKLKQLRKQS
jgi:hypothetical protein